MQGWVEIVQRNVRNPDTPWVLFQHGTVVFLPGQPNHDLAAKAGEILTQWGCVETGSPAGDFNVISMDDGWFVGCHHHDILTLVTPGEVEGDSPSDLEVGLLGRHKRDSDAHKPVVCHVQEGAGGAADLDPRRRLEAGDAGPMTDLLMGTDASITIDSCDGGILVHRETRTAIVLEEPWASLYTRRVGDLRQLVARQGPRGLEVRRRGPLYYVVKAPLEEISAELLVSGIDHTGKMKGSAAQAILAKYGAGAEVAAQEALAKSDRSLGTVVVHSMIMPSGKVWLAQAVSTPKHTPESPGWLQRAMKNVLDSAARLGIRSLAMAALGTSGGIAPEVAARLLISNSQQWFEENPVPLHVTFSLPTSGVRQAFEAEFRRQRIFFTDG